METIGKYRIVREVGKGATATVYLAFDPAKPDEKLALKYISFKTEAQDGGQWSRRLKKLLRAEWSVVHTLNHPNIIRIYDTVIEDDYAYLVMEFIEGTTLEPYCTFDKLLPIHRTVGIIFKVCLALDFAYQHGVVHRDIKPANILVDEFDNVKLTDFGLAMNLNRNKDADSTFIMGVGSPSYMSPEQIKAYPLNQKTDLYSLGVVLFHMLTGRLPFRAKTPAQLIYKIINADPPMPSKLNPEVPAQMDAIIRKSLEKDLYSRYKNGADMAKDLSAVRYRIVDDSFVAMDTTRFNVLRKLPQLTEFDDIELWEVLRMGAWRQLGELEQLCREGSVEKRIWLIVAGEVEISLDGRRLAVVGAGEPVGELAYLDTLPDADVAACNVTAITLTPTTYLEFNPAALALATEECLEKFRQRLISAAARRLAVAQRILARSGEVAVKPRDPFAGLELALMDDDYVPSPAAPQPAAVIKGAPKLPAKMPPPIDAVPASDLSPSSGLALQLEVDTPVSRATPSPRSIDSVPAPHGAPPSGLALQLEVDNPPSHSPSLHPPTSPPLAS